jgi:hypothetical protein
VDGVALALAIELEEGEGVAMDEARAGEAIFQLGRLGSMARMKWAGTWAARRVVETTRMEVKCMLDGGLMRVVDVFCGVDIEAVVGVGVGGSEMVEGEEMLIAF